MLFSAQVIQMQVKKKQSKFPIFSLGEDLGSSATAAVHRSTFSGSAF